MPEAQVSSGLSLADLGSDKMREKEFPISQPLPREFITAGLRNVHGHCLFFFSFFLFLSNWVKHTKRALKM